MVCHLCELAMIEDGLFLSSVKIAGSIPAHTLVQPLLELIIAKVNLLIENT